jgi:PE-PPE domain
MVSRGRRGLGLGISAIAGASVLGLTLMTGPPVAFAADMALILGGSGLPNPPQSAVDAVVQLYLVPNGYGAYTPQVLITPEQLYPITGVNSLSADTSVAQGVTILDSAIRQQIADGNHVVVFGYSQSAAVASQEEAQLAASSNLPSPSQLSFVLLGDPSNPDGGFNQRFAVPGAPLSLPSLGQTFDYAPAANNTSPTAVYTQEYDGFADFPQYPIDLLADLNAYVGIFTQHFSYLDLTPQQISSAIALPMTGNTTTQYYMIPTANLPLLAPVRLIPLIGNPLADLLQPDLRVLINLGYGSITNGWTPGPANVPTPFGLFPTNINPADVLTALANGAVQGVTNALNDLKTPTLFDTSSLSGFLAGFHTIGFTPSNSPSLLQLVAGFTAFGNGGVPVSSTGDVVNTLTSVISNDLAVAKPLADTALAIGASLPAYDAELFTSQLQAGNLLNAVGLPIAADLGLVPFALIAGAIFPIVGAAATTVTQLAELAGLEPNPSVSTNARVTPQVTTATPQATAPQVTTLATPQAKTDPPSADPPSTVPTTTPKTVTVTTNTSLVTPAATPNDPAAVTAAVTPNGPAAVTPNGPAAVTAAVTPNGPAAVTPNGPAAVTAAVTPNGPPKVSAVTPKHPPAVTPTHATQNLAQSSPKAVSNTGTTPSTGGGRHGKH